MPKEEAAKRREAKRWKQRHGMRVSGRSVRDLLAGLLWGGGAQSSGSSSEQSPPSSGRSDGSSESRGHYTSGSASFSYDGPSVSGKRQTQPDLTLSVRVPSDAIIAKTSRGKYLCPVCGATWWGLEAFWIHHLSKTHYRCATCGHMYVGLDEHKRRMRH